MKLRKLYPDELEHALKQLSCKNHESEHTALNQTKALPEISNHPDLVFERKYRLMFCSAIESIFKCDISNLDQQIRDTLSQEKY